MPPYAQASASYTIQVIGNTVTFDAWALDAVPFGAQPFQIKAPTSNVTQAGNTPTIKYSTLNGDTSVVSITDTGMVTVKAKGTATIVAEQAPVGTFAGGKTEATLEVTARSWRSSSGSIDRPRGRVVRDMRRSMELGRPRLAEAPPRR